jgi:ribA/ribD-fused uncharacterized protein
MTICILNIDGIIYNSTENYYQAMKSLDDHERRKIAGMAPNKSKRYARTIQLRPDWEEVKYEVMKKALLAKFSIPEWRDKLLATGDEMIIEWNNWNDKIWGVSIKDYEGQNLLGKCLMEVRDILKL